jgi:hypothetical protein
MNEKNQDIKDMVQRLMSREQWTAPATPTQHIPDTPVELQRVCAAAINSILEMNIPTSGAVIRTQLDLLNSVIHLFVRAVARGCDAPAKLIRPAPPLTRYKEDLLKKAEKGEHVRDGCDPQLQAPGLQSRSPTHHQPHSRCIAHHCAM